MSQLLPAMLALSALTFAEPARTAGVSTFTLPGSAGWFDTHIDLKAGDRVSITATGMVHFCDHCKPSNDVGPAGFPQFPADKDAPGPGLPSVSLIARVGSGAPVYIGSGPTIVKGEGRMRLVFNDSFLPDNSGAFTVSVEPAGKSHAVWLLAAIAAIALATLFLWRKRQPPPESASR